MKPDRLVRSLRRLLSDSMVLHVVSILSIVVTLTILLVVRTPLAEFLPARPLLASTSMLFWIFLFIVSLVFKVVGIARKERETQRTGILLALFCFMGLTTLFIAQPTVGLVTFAVAFNASFAIYHAALFLHVGEKKYGQNKDESIVTPT